MDRKAGIMKKKLAIIIPTCLVIGAVIMTAKFVYDNREFLQDIGE
jgi:hypothetical protein